MVAYLCIGESGNMSRLSETELLGLGVASAVTPFLNASAYRIGTKILTSN